MANLANAARLFLLRPPTLGARRRPTHYLSGRLRVRLVLAATVASCSSPGPAPSVPPPAGPAGPSASNEPVGYAPILTSGFGGQPADRWILGTPAGTIQEVLPTVGAPGGSPGSVRVTYPAGWIPVASAPSPKYRQIVGGGIRNTYLSFWLLLSPGWKAGPQGVDNVLALRTTPGATELRIAFMEVRGTDLVPSLRLQGLHQPYQGVAAPLLVPTASPGTTVQRGAWQRWELHLQSNDPGQSNGKLTWWLNGLLAADYGGLEFWGPDGPTIRDVAWDLTTPTTGTAIQQRGSLDEMYLSAPAAQGDRVVVMNDLESGTMGQAPGGTTVLMDGYTGAAANPCPNDLAIADRSVLPNLLLAGNHCRPDEIIVFSTDDAATIDGAGGSQNAAQGPPQGIWHDADRERRVEASRGLRPVDVVLWIAQEKDLRNREVKPIALGEVDLASVLYNEHRAGLRFNVMETNDVWDNSPNSVAARGAMGCASVNGTVACTCESTLVTSGFFRSGKVNAYYVPEVFDNPGQPRLVDGLNCRYGHDKAFLDPNIVFISIATRSPTLLAHELGHALGLEHTADGSGPWYQGVPGDNVMRDDAWLVSASVLLGQAFRVNVDSRSVLRRNGLQTGPQRPCDCELGAACTQGEYVAKSTLGTDCPPVTRAWP